MANKTEIERSYIDNYAIKEFVTNNLVPKYFPDIDASLRTVGTIGMVSELISNIAEDSFNSTSALFKEIFPNRAELPESIYSHASIFQLSNIFSTASACTFLIVLEEESIIKNMTKDENAATYSFYLDKNTTVYVEEVPYVLDYDVRIRCVLKRTSDDEQYIFSASYVKDEYTNSISNVIDPYIKLRRSNNGYLALEVTMHQVTRDVHYEQIITNSKINMPYVDIQFDGQLVGFDVLYKTPEETSYSTQMQKLLVYSHPLTTEFCYYQLYDDNTLRLSFNARDGYFIPKFNSELKVILYMSRGKEANFDEYNGSNISIETADDSIYNYDTNVIMTAKTLSGSIGGADRLGLEELQALTVESYRTALALTTESDLTTFFANYKYSYGDFAIQFIKRRNDVYERIFGGYCLMQYGSEIFKTNTLDIHMNIHDMTKPEENIYMIEPGTLFTYANNTKEIEVLYDKDGSYYTADGGHYSSADKLIEKIHVSRLNSMDGLTAGTKDVDTKYVTFFRDSDKNNQYYTEYVESCENGECLYNSSATDNDNYPEYFRNRNISFAEFKSRKGYSDKLRVFDLAREDVELRDDPMSNQYMFINPFLIRVKKSPNLVSMYQTYINEKSTVDFTDQNRDMFVQFVMQQVQIERKFDKNREYTVTTSIMPSITIDLPVIEQIGVDSETGEKLYNTNNRYTLDKNDLRVLFVVYNDNKPVCYSEMYPIEFNNGTNLKYETKFSTDDYITSDNRLRLLDDTIYLVVDSNNIDIDPEISNGWYFKVTSDNTLYNLYDENDNIRQSNISLNVITALASSGYVKTYSKIVNMKDNDDILIPMENVECKVFTLYKRRYVGDSAGSSSLEENTPADTNNIFTQYDSTYDKYVWTNEYTTGLEPLTFIKPMNHVRSALYFEDYTMKQGDVYLHDILDVRMESVPFVKWDLGYNDESMATFMTSFTTQYENINNIINNRLRNETSIDVKLYNTYGKSTNYYVGDSDELLNSLNLTVAFDMWFVSGTDIITVVPEVKRFIKEKIETISDNGTNQIHVSNLMREIEHNFSYIDHIRFKGFNNYSTDYQSIKLIHTDINEMTKEERRKYVPELLVIDLDNITINEYIV